MNYDYTETPLSKSILAGVATGIIATVINLIYNFIFRGITHLSLEITVINVSTVIFVTMILCLIAGFVYYGIVLYLRKSMGIFVALFLAITAIAVVLGIGFHISTDANISQQFDSLYIGMVLITGLLGAFLIPYLASHKNPFFD